MKTFFTSSSQSEKCSFKLIATLNAQRITNRTNSRGTLHELHLFETYHVWTFNDVFKISAAAQKKSSRSAEFRNAENAQTAAVALPGKQKY